MNKWLKLLQNTPAFIILLILFEFIIMYLVGYIIGGLLV